MTPTAKAVRKVLGDYTSEAKCREVVQAVLLAVREPSEAVINSSGQRNHIRAIQDWRAGIDALLQQEASS